ncbi:MAG: hypothetical protein U9R58_14675 [Chloroflexota bacterium]|nr:hypothetical protein [Chloroflexota bacterium]
MNLLAVLMILTGIIHIGSGPVGEEIDIQRWRRSASILGQLSIPTISPEASAMSENQARSISLGLSTINSKELIPDENRKISQAV